MPKNKLTTVLFVIVLVIISYFIGKSISSQWVQIRHYHWKLHYGWLLCSAALFWVITFHLLILWRYLLYKVSGRKMRLVTAFRITVLANLGKYIPGKVWTVLGMFYMLNREGYSTTTALACSVLHQGFTLAAGMVFIPMILGEEILPGMPLLLLSIGAAISVLILYPPVFRRLLNLGLRILRREPIDVTLTFGQSIVLFLLYMFSWIMYGTTFWCLLHGLSIQSIPYWKTVASYGAAYLLGFVALFAPGGLGVREGILTVLMAGILEPGIAALVAVVARLWMTLLEVSQVAVLSVTKGTRGLTRPQR
jgi:uncharacterized membrane protein YbhN (UPF0104 family)